MFGKKSKAVVAGLSLVMALAPAVPAFAGTVSATSNNNLVEKELQLNNGSTVNATFKFTATKAGVLSSATDAGKKTEATDKTPVLTIDDITINNTDSSTDKDLDKKSSLHATFDHAGYYAWYVTETGSTYEGNGTMTYSTTEYTVVATVQNDTSEGAAEGALLAPTFTVVEGHKTSLDDVKAPKKDTAKFTNEYTELSDDRTNNHPLTITKTVTGTQGDETKDFNFTVTFSTPEGFVNNTDWTLASITAAKDGTQLTNNNGTFTFTAKSADEVQFNNVMAGVTYTVTETEANADGYDTSYSGQANGVNTSTNEGNLVGEKENDLTVTNHKDGSVITGVVMNNAPFIVMIGVAAAGVAAYGAAKRKLEK